MEESWWEFIIFEGVRCSLLYSFWHDLCGGKREFKSGIFIDKSVQLFHVSEEFHEISYWYLFHILHNNELLFRNSNKIDCVYQKSPLKVPNSVKFWAKDKRLIEGLMKVKKLWNAWIWNQSIWCWECTFDNQTMVSVLFNFLRFIWMNPELIWRHS